MAEPLRERLRRETADAHRALEAALDLLGPATDAARLRRVLEGFHGFHQAFEPALARRLADEAFCASRRRLAALRADLLTLGAAPAAIDALPRCDAAAALADALPGALGALYVTEGSTLGGRLIARTLGERAWWPEHGLRYFDAHGAATATRWQETLARIGSAPAAAHDGVVAGARATFALLQGWLSSYRNRAETGHH